MPKYTPAHVIGVAFAFSLLVLFTRITLDSGANVLTVVTLRTLLVVLILGIFLKVTGVSLALDRRERNVAIAIGVVAGVNNFAFNNAIGLLPVPLAVLILYTYPALTSIAAWIEGSERPGVRSVTALALAFCGLAITLQADFGAYSAAGLAYAATASFAWTGVLLLSVRFFRGADPRPRTFYMQATVLTFFSIALLATGDIRFPQSALGWWSMASLPLTYSIGLIGALAAASSMGAARMSFYMNIEPVFAIVLSALFLNQTLAPMQLVGAAMVIAALFLFRPLRRESLPPQL